MSSSAMFGCGIVLVLCLVGSSVAQDEFEDSGPPTEEEMAREIGQFLATIQSLFDPNKNMTDFPDANGYCTCERTHCRCCQRFLGMDFCVVLEHHSHSDLLEISLKCGNTKIISHTFSVRNHPPFCFYTASIPGARVCLHLNSVRINHGKVHACISISAKYWIISKTFDLGCFNVMRNNEKMELTKAVNLTHETAKQVEQPDVWIKEGEPIVAFPGVFKLVKLFKAAGNVEQPLQDQDQM